jgi:hypothetical protein
MEHERRMLTDSVYARVYDAMMHTPQVYIFVFTGGGAAPREPPKPRPPRCLGVRARALMQRAAGSLPFRMGCLACALGATYQMRVLWLTTAALLFGTRVRALTERGVVALRWTPLSVAYCFVASAAPEWSLPRELKI